MTHPPQAGAHAGPYVPPPAPHLRHATDIAEAAELEPEALALALPGLPVRDFVAALAAAGRVEDALAVVAHVMPRREAVWWAWASARRVLAEPVPPKIMASLQATERWISQPSDENRRAAYDFAEKAGMGTAAGCAGLGAFISGGSVAPPGLPDVHPTEFLTGKAVFSSLLVAGVTGDATQAQARYAAFLQQGLDVMARLNLWPAA